MTRNGNERILMVAEHKEQWLLVYIFGELTAHQPLRIESESQKRLVLGIPNLVECIAEAGGMTGDSGSSGSA